MSGIIKEAFNVIISKCKCKCKGSGKCSSILSDKELDLRDVKNPLMVYAFRKVVERGESGETTTEKTPAEKSAAKAAAFFFGDPPSKLDFILEHRNWCINQMTKPLLHDFDEIFRKMFNEKDFSIAEEIFRVTTDRKPIEYHYPLDKDSHAVIEILEEDTICAILRLWYGIRCISAHGMATQTFSKDGALYKFPDCEKCQKLAQKDTRCKELQMLCNGQDLCKEIEKICESEMPEPPESSTSVSVYRYAKIKSIPDLRKIQSSGNKKACKLVDELGLKQDGCSRGNVYYHISRIAFFASNLEKRMYITYRLLVRINQFVLLLAFRIKLAVAKYLVKYSKEENGKIDDLKEGLWGYVVNVVNVENDDKSVQEIIIADNEKVLKLIDEVQGEHKEKIKKIQKSTER